MADQDEYLVEKLNGYLEWAKSDKDIVGLIPWHWLNEPSPQTSIIGLGMQSFPKLVARLNVVGAELRNVSSAELRQHDLLSSSTTRSVAPLRSKVTIKSQRGILM